MKFFITALSMIAYILTLAATGQAQTLTIPLNRLASVGVVDLKGPTASYGIKLPVPERWAMHSTTLHFSYANSSTLKADRSHLVLRLNGHPVAQIALSPTATQGDVRVTLPVDILRVGYNDLEFSVAQNVEDECVPPAAGDLWTTLMLDRAETEFEFDLKDVPLNLNCFDNFLFDARLAIHPEIIFLLQDMKPATLHAAALAASGIALRMDYQPVRFRVASAPVPGHDHVIVGNADFAAKHLATRPDAAGKALLAMTHLSSPQEKQEEDAPGTEREVDRTHAMIVVCGESEQELIRAATALSLRNYPLPQSAQTRIEKIEIPDIPAYAAKMMLQPDSAYKLSALGFATHTFSGMRAPGKDISFRLASDLLLEPQKNAELELKVSYGSRMRQDSVLNVFVNETFVGAIPLDESHGGQFRGYKILIPAYVLQNGFNRMTFSPALTPEESGRCLYTQEKNLHVTVYGDSILSVPALDHFIELPDLKGTMHDGFPFGVWPDLRQCEIRLPDAQHETISAALNLVALMAQQSGIPPLQLQFSEGNTADPKRHGIMIGVWNELPEDIRHSTQLADKAPAILAEFHQAEQKPEGLGNRLLAKYLPEAVPPAVAPNPTPAWMYQDQQLGRGNILLAQFLTPGSTAANPRLTWLLTAMDAADLASGSAILWEPAVQGRIDQDTCLVRLKGPESTTWPIRVQPRLYLGHVGVDQGLSGIILNHPWISLGMLAGLFTVFVIATQILLVNYRRRRLNHED